MEEKFLNMLEEQQKFIALQTELLSKAMQNLNGAPNTALNKNEDAQTEKTMDTLAKSMSDFHYDPENNSTFKNWYARYSDWFEVDAAKLKDDAKVRLLLRKLDTTAHARYLNYILPKTTRDFNFEETIEQLEKIFDHQMSLFNMRYNCMKIIKRPDDDFISYAGNVNRQCEDFKLANLTNDQFKCLIFVCGLNSSKDSDIRTRLLSKLDSDENVTLDTLTTESKRLIALKHDTNMIEKQIVSVQQIKQPFSKIHSDKSSSKIPKKACWFCGKFHYVQFCDFKNHECKDCKRVGHKEGFCSNARTNQSQETSKQKSSYKRRHHNKPKTNGVFMVSKIDYATHRKFITVNINGVPIKFQLDTASDISIISMDNWHKIGSPVKTKCTNSAKNASGEILHLLSQFETNFSIGNNSPISGTCYISNINDLNLLGIDWIEKFGLWDVPINTICNQVNCYNLNHQNVIEELQRNFPSVFEKTLGTCTKTTASLQLKPNTKAIFRPKRPVPYAALEAVENELNRLEEIGVIKRVDFSSWAAPIVVTKKSNGSVRICADFSTGLNNALESHQYPLPLPEDIFATLAGGKFFSKIDCADAYLQIMVDDNSKQLLTINTHRGLYQYNRLCFGIKSAPGIFQQIMDTMLAGLPGVVSYLDDLIVVGRTFLEHQTNLNKLFKTIEEWGFHLNLEKSRFFQSSINYLGFIIDSQGRRPDPEKTAVIVKMPPPTDVTTLRSFIGMINYYGQFINNMRELRSPFDKLLTKDTKFSWSKECQQSFIKVKQILQSDLLLTHFDPQLEIKVAADASQYGLGAVILHRFPDKTEKAIAHAARALTPAEQQYSQIEKEGLALVFALTKFHRMLHGRKFILSTDHKPLLSIFGSKKGIPIHTANRLQRWSLTLLSYDFTIEHVGTTKFGHADALSRLMDRSQVKYDEDPVIAAISTVDADVYQVYTDAVRNLPITSDVIISATASDKTLQKVLKYQKSTWPDKIKDITLQTFFNRRESLSEINGSILFSDRIVIPYKLQKKVLQQLHSGHPGIARMKAIARSYVYWPRIDADIEELVKRCVNCASAAKSPVKTTLSSWPMVKSPWSRIHIDFAGPFQGHYFLVIIDAYSKWPEIAMMSQITTSSTIYELKSVFARFGLPQTLVSDNGTQFTSTQFSEFCKTNGINHIRSPPYHPQSNGQAERFVDTFKRAMLKMKEEGITRDILLVFLQSYRNTPNPALPNNISPAEAIFGRKCRTILTLMNPTNSQMNIPIHNKKMEESFNKQHGAKQKSYKVNQSVYVIEYHIKKKTWVPAIITRCLGKVTYMVKIGDKEVHRHANQIRLRLEDTDIQNTPTNSSSLPFNILTDLFNINYSTSIINEPLASQPSNNNLHHDIPEPTSSSPIAYPAPSVVEVPAEETIQSSLKQFTRYPERKRRQPVRFNPSIN